MSMKEIRESYLLMKDPESNDNVDSLNYFEIFYL